MKAVYSDYEAITPGSPLPAKSFLKEQADYTRKRMKFYKCACQTKAAKWWSASQLYFSFIVGLRMKQLFVKAKTEQNFFFFFIMLNVDNKRNKSKL